MEWIATERGGKKLLLDGYIYVKRRNMAGGWDSYECELRRNRNSECKAKIKVSSNNNEFCDKTEHNHPPDHGKANAYKLRNAMKRMAAETDQSPKQILLATMHEATEEGMMAMPGLENIKRSIRRQRQGSREAFVKYRVTAGHGLDGQVEAEAAEHSVEPTGVRNQLGCVQGETTVAEHSVEPGVSTLEGCVQGVTTVAEHSVVPSAVSPKQGCIHGKVQESVNMIKELEARKDQRLMASGDDPMPHSKLGQVISNIQRQRLQKQKNSKASETSSSNENLEDLECHRSSGTDQGLSYIQRPNKRLGNVDEETQECHERLNIIHRDLKGQRSSVNADEGLASIAKRKAHQEQRPETSGDSPLNLQGQSSIWESIKKRQQDIQEAFAECHAVQK